MNHLNNTNDREWILRIKNNDSKALDLLFAKFYQSLCHFSFYILKNTALAEEAVSDVFLNIWLKRNKINIHNSVKAYLFTAVRNQSLNYLKKSKIHFDDIDEVENENIQSCMSADYLIRYESVKNDVELILNKLPEKRRLIFRMNRFDGLSYKEIASILSISVNTVQNQMVKAVKFISEYAVYIEH